MSQDVDPLLVDRKVEHVHMIFELDLHQLVVAQSPTNELLHIVTEQCSVDSLHLEDDLLP